MVAMPAVAVLIVCKVVVAGPDDQNAHLTGARNLEWATEHAMMQCRRHEVSLFDADAAKGAASQPFTMQVCWRSAIMLGTNWDAMHGSSNYRTWRVACPVPIVNTITGEIIAWQLPPCGHRDTVRCEADTTI
jgi:hypothetical protein